MTNNFHININEPGRVLQPIGSHTGKKRNRGVNYCPCGQRISENKSRCALHQDTIFGVTDTPAADKLAAEIFSGKVVLVERE